MWITSTTFKHIAEHVRGQPRRNSKNRFDKRSYVAAAVEVLFAEELETEQNRLIELHCNMKPTTHLTWKTPRRGADDPDVYAALAAMGEEDRVQFEGLWRQAEEAEHARQQTAANAPVKGRASDGQAEAAGQVAAASQDLGEEGNGHPGHKLHQRTDFRTPAALRCLLSGEGTIAGLALICGCCHVLGDFALPSLEPVGFESMALPRSGHCYRCGGMRQYARKRVGIISISREGTDAIRGESM